MGLSTTLSAYLARHIAFWLAAVFVIVTGVAFLFDTVEMLRRSAGKTDIGIIPILQMCILKLPFLVQQLLPFCVLLGATLAFWNLARANELVVTRAAGVSVWQILAPLSDVIIFLFEGDDHFIGRIDAENARLRDGYWDIRNAWISSPNKRPYHVTTHRMDTDLTLNKILDSFASPETMSFWQLPSFIKILEKAGFTGHRHKLYWHSLLASPMLMAAMVLVAAIFALRASSRAGAAWAISGAVLCGFLLYFMSDLVYALGLSASIPALLAAWTPAGVSTLLGLSALFHIEDG